MKVPPKRKGNALCKLHHRQDISASMKVPPKRKGNTTPPAPKPSEPVASMKVPPKRKGNVKVRFPELFRARRLNESPSEKEGKFCKCGDYLCGAFRASMKVPPKRKGNLEPAAPIAGVTGPQ